MAVVKGWTLEIDAAKCVGCYNCVLACSDEHAGIDHPGVSASQPQTGSSWVRVAEQERGSFPRVRVDYVPRLCLQCEDAPCVAAGGGAVYRRPDGIVIIDPVAAAGRPDIARACPHGAITWNEEKQLAQKCTLCAHLLDAGWKEPRCVEACPAGAFAFSGRAYPAAAAVLYSNLPARFITGEIAFADRPEVPAAGVPVTLCGPGGDCTFLTDGFGEFAFEGLPGQVDYRLSVTHAGYAPREVEARAGSDPNAGTIVLQPAVSPPT